MTITEKNENKKKCKMDIDNIECPKFAWIVMICLGCVDLYRGFTHTVRLEYAAMEVFVIDMSGGVGNQMLLLGLFGITNFLTGIMFILIGLKARQLVPIILPMILVAYLFGRVFIYRVATPTASLGGTTMMTVYLFVCFGTFVAIVVVKIKKRYFD